MNPSELPSWSAVSRLVRGGCGLVTLIVMAAPAASAATMSISLQQLDRNNPAIVQGTLGAVDLTAGGLALDWMKPVTANLSLAEKDQANLLNFSLIGTFTPANYSNDGYTFSWSGGDSASPTGSSFQGANNSSATVGLGFRLNFVAPAPGDYTVTYYSAANGDITKYRLTGFLDTLQLDARSAGANIGSDSVDELIWTVQINADAAGENFNLDLTRQTGATSSAIAITGATVVPEPMSAAMLLLGAVAQGAKRRQR